MLTFMLCSISFACGLALNKYLRDKADEKERPKNLQEALCKLTAEHGSCQSCCALDEMRNCGYKVNVKSDENNSDISIRIFKSF